MLRVGARHSLVCSYRYRLRISAGLSIFAYNKIETMSITNQLIQAVAQATEVLYGQRATEGQIQVQKCKREFEGHLTVVAFPLLKLSRKNPEQTATELGAWLLEHSELVSAMQVVKGFLNLTIAPSAWLQQLRQLQATPNYGHITPAEDAPLVMVEYSSPNTNKPLHLGHVRNNLLGYSLAQILEAQGMRVVKTNIVNDRGIHICKSMLAWKKWGEGVTPATAGKKGDHLIGDFYVLFDKHYKAELNSLMQAGASKDEAEAQSTLMAEAREMLRLWEEGDEETVSLWRTMNQWVYEGFDATYQRMGVSFDKIYYESDTYLIGRDEVLRGLAEGILVQDADGSVWLDLTAEGLDRKILLRSDGTSVYMTQDIGTAKLRYRDYAIDKMVYVVGNEQNYHFQVLSHALDKLGFKFGRELVHFSYGMVELPEGKMKSREGTVVDADDLMDEMQRSALEIAQEQGKAKDMTEAEALEVARRVGLGSLKYFILKVDPKKNMVFNPKESIDFQGNTGSFIQYTYARIRSVLRRAQEAGHDLSQWQSASDLCLEDKEQELVARLGEYAEVLAEAARSYSPAVIANYTYELVKEYNQFYHDYSILREEREAVRSLRLCLSHLVASTIQRAMSLLGIEMPERM